MLRAKKGFTLVELLVIITIIGALVAVFLTYGRVAVASAKDAKKKSNADDIRVALNLYAKDHEDTFPIHTDAGGYDVVGLTTELGTVYMTDNSVLQPVNSKVTNKYVSNSDGSAYALAFGLEGKKGSTVSFGSGIYKTYSSNIAGAVSVGNFVSPALSYGDAESVTTGTITTDFDTNVTNTYPYEFASTAWIKPSDVSRMQYLMNQMTFNVALPNVTPGAGWAVSMVPSDATHSNISFTLCPDQACLSPYTLTSTNSPITQGAWNHIAFVAQQSNAFASLPNKNHALAGEPSGPVKLYFTLLVNGTPVAQTVAAGCTTCTAWSNQNNNTVKFGYGSLVGYSGLLDDFRIYSSRLTQAQITTIYNGGVGSYGSCSTGNGMAYKSGIFGRAKAVVGLCSGDPSLVAGWRLDEMTGSTATSYFGTHNATINPDKAEWVAAGVVPIGLSGIRAGSTSTYDSSGLAYVLTNVQ